MDAVAEAERLKALPAVGWPCRVKHSCSEHGPLQAAALDKKLANGGAEMAGPLAGVPIAIKVRHCRCACRRASARFRDYAHMRALFLTLIVRVFARVSQSSNNTAIATRCMHAPHAEGMTDSIITMAPICFNVVQHTCRTTSAPERSTPPPAPRSLKVGRAAELKMRLHHHIKQLARVSWPGLFV